MATPDPMITATNNLNAADTLATEMLLRASNLVTQGFPGAAPEQHQLLTVAVAQVIAINYGNIVAQQR
jgi:hypothetical protein